MTPDQLLSVTKNAEAEMRRAKKMSVDVGLIKAKIGGKIYDNGQTVMEVGATHEYGIGNVPQRSFLRTPFMIKSKEIKAFIAGQFSRISTGQLDADTALGRVGAYATNISSDAFTNQGYGTWPALDEKTIDAKGSSQILIDTGILRSSITWQVNQ